MSMSDILAALLFLLVALRHSKADRRLAKYTFALIQDMVVAWSSTFFNASSFARRLCNLLHSSAIPPVLLKTKCVNVPCSTSRTRLLYCLFFSFSCSWNICFRDSSRYDLRLDSTPEHQRTQIAVYPKTREREHLDGHQALCLSLYFAPPQ